jgi:hypothetical protein
MNVCGVNPVTQNEAHTAVQLLSKPSYFKDETVAGKLKRSKSPGTDQILAELT